MSKYFDQDFLVTAEGEGFVLTFRGLGDMEAGKAAVAAMTGLPCTVQFVGLTPEERADMQKG